MPLLPCLSLVLSFAWLCSVLADRHRIVQTAAASSVFVTLGAAFSGIAGAVAGFWVYMLLIRPQPPHRQLATAAATVGTAVFVGGIQAVVTGTFGLGLRAGTGALAVLTIAAMLDDIRVPSARLIR